MEIRRLTVADAPAYRELRLRSFREHPEAFTTSFEELQAQPFAQTEKRLADPANRFWGAFDAGRLCGHVGLERETRMKTRHRAKLVGMYVAPEAAGHGIGRALVDVLVQDARAEGIELIVLTVTDGNSKATQLYERCGFRSFGVEPKAIKLGERLFAKRHMALDLTAAS